MRKRVIIVEHDDDDVIIDLREHRQARARRDTEEREAAPASHGLLRSPGKGALSFSSRMCNLIELRAESSFRVNQPDFEIIYALSGSDEHVPDTFHHFASQQVVEDARPDTVTPLVSGIVDLIKKEREGSGSPRLIVVNHTHPAPGNVPRPSSNDERFFQSAGEVLRDQFPGAMVVFGVHAISGESIRRREPPAKMESNCLRWTSVIREHELAFFSPDGREHPVEYHG